MLCHIIFCYCFLGLKQSYEICSLMSGLKVCQKIPANLQIASVILSYAGRQCVRCPYTCLSVPRSELRRRGLSTGANLKFSSSYLSDPENKGKRQKGVNFDTIGSWNNRIDMSISLKKSIEKGRLIPEIPLGSYIFVTHY